MTGLHRVTIKWLWVQRKVCQKGLPRITTIQNVSSLIYPHFTYKPQKINIYFKVMTKCWPQEIRYSYNSRFQTTLMTNKIVSAKCPVYSVLVSFVRVNIWIRACPGMNVDGLFGCKPFCCFMYLLVWILYNVLVQLIRRFCDVIGCQ